jgi:hypothetical protein
MIHFDTETHAISVHEQAPPVVCLQWCWAPPVSLTHDRGTEAYAVDADPKWRGMSSLDVLGPVPDEEATEDDNPAEDARSRPSWHEDVLPSLVTGDDMLDMFRAILEGEVLAQGVNSSFDAYVLLRHADRRGLNLWRSAFEFLARGQLRDTELDEKLINIARGIEVHKTGLEAMAYRYLGVDIKDDKKGPNAWRLRYGELDGVPLERWPYHAKRYAIDDVLLDRAIHRAHLDVALRTFGTLEIPDQAARPVARFCLHLQSARGFLSDYPRATAARESLREASDRLMGVLVKAGLVRTKTLFTGPDALAEGDLCTVDGEPATFLGRVDVKGRPNPKARSAKVEINGEEAIVALAQVVGDSAVKHTKNMKEIRERIAATFNAAGNDVPLTETGLVKSDRDVLEILAELSDDPGLLCLTAKSAVDKLLSTYVEPLCEPRVEHGGSIHWRYDCLKDTGRTSAAAQRFVVEGEGGVSIKMRDGTNVQNLPGQNALQRTAKRVLEWLPDPKPSVEEWARKHDPRAMVIARPGYLFSIYDYSAIELGTMARILNVMLGKPSTLAQVINDGKDPHLFVGVRVHRTLWGESLTYEQLVERRHEAEVLARKGKVPPELKRVLDTRKMTKIVNFGFLGAMGAQKFVDYARLGYGVQIALPLAKELRKDFLIALPEIPVYFKAISDRMKEGLPIIQYGTKRVRRPPTYAAACNSPFQGLAADGAMQALWLLTWAAYVDPESPLYGSFPLIFEHDAFLSEVPEDRAEPAHREIGRLMIEGMEVYLKDRRRPELSVAVRVEGELIQRDATGYSRWVK